MAQFHLTAGHPSANGESFPLDSSACHGDINFSLFCKHGTSIELLLFDSVDDIEPARVITLDPGRNKTYHYWHTFLPNILSGRLYWVQPRSTVAVIARL